MGVVTREYNPQVLIMVLIFRQTAVISLQPAGTAVLLVTVSVLVQHSHVTRGYKGCAIERAHVLPIMPQHRYASIRGETTLGSPNAVASRLTAASCCRASF